MDERGDQVAAVADWLHRGRALLMVVGEAGAGKTTLLDATMPSTAVRCSARSVNDMAPLGSVRALLAQLDVPQPPELQDLTDRCPGLDREERVADAATALGALLSGRLVVLDDAHWADPTSLRLLGRAVRDAVSPTLVVGTRPWSVEHHPGVADLVGAAGPVTVTVPPLTPDGLRRMLDKAAPDRVFSDAELRELHRRTGGLPLLVESLISSSSGNDSGTGLTTYVAHELARLGPDAARVARAIAVLRGTGTLTDVAAVSGQDPAAVTDLVDAIAAAGLLGTGLAPRIRHPMLEDLVAAHGGPGAARSANARAARHAHAAGGDPDRLVAFLMHAWPLGETWAAEALRDAARTARRAADPRRARALATRARAEQVLDADARGELDTIEAWTALQLAPGPAAVARAEEIVACQEDSGAPGWASRTRAELVEFAMLTGDDGLARTHARALLTAAGDDLEQQARSLRAFLGATYLGPGTERERLAVLGEARTLLASERVDALPVLAHAAVTFATAGLDAEARAAVDRLLDVRLERHPQMLVELGLVGVALVQLERLDEAAGAFADIGRAAERHRIDDIAANARVWRARIAAWQGDAPAARTAATELADGPVWPVLRPVAAATLLAGALLDGTATEVADALTAGRAELAAPAVPHGPGVADLLLTCAKAEHALGRPAAAVALVARAVAAYPVADWLAPWPLVALQVDGSAALSQAASPILARWASLARPVTGNLATSWPTPWVCLGPEAPHQASTPLPLHTELLLLQGRTLRRAGRNAAARPVLHRSLSAAVAAGHHHLAAAAHDELHLAGGRARVQARPFGLTPAEQRVAVLAADGRTNREIGEVLVVSVKTVESHMSKLLAKTGRRRDDLGVVAAEIEQWSPTGQRRRESAPG